MTEPEVRRSIRLPLLLGGVVAALTPLVLLLDLGAPTATPPPPDATPADGPGALELQLLVGEAGALLAPGAEVLAGEAVAVAVITDRDAYVGALRVDAGGALHVVYPDQALVGRLPASPSPAVLGAPIVLDGPPGLERFVAVSCQAPWPGSAHARALGAAAAVTDPGAPLPHLDPACAQAEVQVRLVTPR